MTTHDSDIVDFLSAISPEDNWPPMRLGRGTIKAYDSTNKKVTITIAGGTTEIPGILYFSHYTPVVGDDVHIVSVGGDKMVWGKLARP